MTNEFAHGIRCFALFALAACGSAHNDALFAECVAPQCTPSATTSNADQAGASSAAGGPEHAMHGQGDIASGGASSAGGAADSNGSLDGGGAGDSPSMGGAGAGASNHCVTQMGVATALTVYHQGSGDHGCSLELDPPRSGTWFTFDDGTGSPTPSSSVSAHPGNPSDRGCSVVGTGKGTTNWGGGIGFVLNGNEASACPYDAAAYGGLALYLKGSTVATQGPNYQANENIVRVDVVTTATSDIDGTCLPADEKCNDHFGAWCLLSQDWTRCDVPFDNLSQRGWGAVKHFDKAQLLKIQITVVRDSAGSRPTDWDIAVDDVAFYR